MDIRVLQYFLAVVREENITKAAQLLHITQPTLSRQLMGLEQELGVKLFSRNNHSVTLTEEGMLFRRRAEEIVTLSEMTKRELKQEAERKASSEYDKLLQEEYNKRQVLYNPDEGKSVTRT